MFPMGDRPDLNIFHAILFPFHAPYLCNRPDFRGTFDLGRWPIHPVFEFPLASPETPHALMVMETGCSCFLSECAVDKQTVRNRSTG